MKKALMTSVRDQARTWARMSPTERPALTVQRAYDNGFAIGETFSTLNSMMHKSELVSCAMNYGPPSSEPFRAWFRGARDGFKKRCIDVTLQKQLR